jgi:hypothetical protein
MSVLPLPTLIDNFPKAGCPAKLDLSSYDDMYFPPEFDRKMI